MLPQGEIIKDNHENSMTRTINNSADERTSLVTSSPLTSSSPSSPSSSLSVLVTDTSSSSTTPHHHVPDPPRPHRRHPLPLVIATALVVIVASTAITTTYLDTTRTNHNSRLRTNDNENDNDNDPKIDMFDVDGTVGTHTGTRVGIVHCCMNGQDYTNNYDAENCDLDEQSGTCVGKERTKPCGKDETLYQTCCLKSNYESHQYQHFERCG